MALDFKIGSTAYEALPADVKKEYKKSGDDYTLDLNGYEDPAALRTARDNANRERDTAKAERDDFKKKFTDTDKELKDFQKNNGDAAKTVEDLKKAHGEELAKSATAVEGLRKTLMEGARERVASEIASSISGKPKVLLPHITPRIDVEIGDDFTVKTIIKGTDGKPSAMKPEDLGKEFLKNPDFSSIVTASKASGGGGALPPVPGSGGSAPRGNPSPQFRGNGEAVDLSKMSPRDLAAQIKEQKAQNGG